MSKYFQKSYGWDNISKGPQSFLVFAQNWLNYIKFSFAAILTVKPVVAQVPHSQSSLTFLTQVLEIFSFVIHTIL
jgi:hypothetical protein